MFLLDEILYSVSVYVLCDSELVCLFKVSFECLICKYVSLMCEFVCMMLVWLCGLDCLIGLEFKVFVMVLILLMIDLDYCVNEFCDVLR